MIGSHNIYEEHINSLSEKCSLRWTVSALGGITSRLYHFDGRMIKFLKCMEAFILSFVGTLKKFFDGRDKPVDIGKPLNL